MSHSNDTSFTPDKVDQQIDDYLSGQHDTPTEHAAQQAILRFKRIYGVKHDDQSPSLERVWQRVLAAEVQDGTQSVATVDEPEAPLQGVLPLTESTRPQRKRRRVRPLIVDLSVALCLVLIVSSFVWITTHSYQAQLTSTSLSVRSESGLYTYQNQTVYRLDSQTHKILWRHDFTNNEFVQGYTGAVGSNEDQPFAVGGNLYVRTQVTLHPDQQYLYALNVTNGSILWKLSITSSVFATDQAVYTVAESTTSDISTLTAHDPQTGKQMWQHQYNIAGSKGAVSLVLNEGFRLLAVNDQVLYAVTVYHLHGQDFFARYALNPKDGSIIWQNSEVTLGRTVEAYAQIVNGVIYTSEYELTNQTVKQGNNFTTVVYSHVIAYDAASGKRLWRIPELVGEEPKSGFDPIVSGNLLYYQTQSTAFSSVLTLHALNIKDGSQLWTYQVRSDTGSMSAEVLDGNSVYFETSQLISQNPLQHVVALNALTGSVRWLTPVKFQNGTESTPTPVPHSIDYGMSGGLVLDIAPVVSNGTIYYSVSGNRVYALRSSDGKVLSQFWVDKTNQTTIMDRMVFFSTP